MPNITKITIEVEESNDLEAILKALNFGEVGIRVERYVKGEGYSLLVRDREAIKSLAAACRRGPGLDVAQLPTKPTEKTDVR